MPSLKQLARFGSSLKSSKAIPVNWYPGHMYGGMQAMLGKLNTTDAIVEVHDARIPLIGRNKEFKQHLGLIKPRILVLNKADLADLTHWSEVKERLKKDGDENILLTDLSGTSFSFRSRGYDTLLQKVINLINRSDRCNRANADHFKIMIVGIPNVGKSTLINRLRQHHLGLGGDAATVGPKAGVTRAVETRIKICSRPPVYSLDTPGVLEPSQTKDKTQSMKLALCSNINDGVLNIEVVADFLLKFLNKSNNHMYLDDFGLEEQVESIEKLCETAIAKRKHTTGAALNINDICWKFVRNFRMGKYGKVMFV